jgi:hypothetical protein
MVTGRDLAAYELQFRGHRYVWGATGPSTFDCSGLNYYSMGKLGVPEAHAHRTADALYRWCKSRGTLVPVSQARGIIGAWGFAINSSGVAHHVVTSLGNGSTIEAANKKAGVGVFRWDGRFQRAGLCPTMSFGPAPVVATAHPAPTLRDVINLCRIHSQLRPFQFGDGAHNQLEAGVKLIQAALNGSGIKWRAPIPVDGEYGAYTRDCVNWYQHVRSIPVPALSIGAVNRQTFDVMYPP